jgi:hypothetical protein
LFQKQSGAATAHASHRDFDVREVTRALQEAQIPALRQNYANGAAHADT